MERKKEKGTGVQMCPWAQALGRDRRRLTGGEQDTPRTRSPPALSLGNALSLGSVVSFGNAISRSASRNFLCLQTTLLVISKLRFHFH